MQIPESIQAITNEVLPTSLSNKPRVQELPLDEIILLVKRNISLSQLASFEMGLAYTNSSTISDKHIIKSFLGIINEALNQSIIKSDIPGDVRDKIAAYSKEIVTNNTNCFENLYNLIASLNKEKNLLDVKDITFIILGYVIRTLKKIYNN